MSRAHIKSLLELEQQISRSDGILFHFDNDIDMPIFSQVRYIRDYMNGNTVNTGNHWVEIQAYDARGNNIAAGKSGTTSNGAFDTLITNGITSTNPYFSLPEGEQWVQVDLGGLYEISAVKIWHYYSDGRTYYGTKTMISADGTNWIVIFDSANSGEYAETANGHLIPINNMTHFNTTYIYDGYFDNAIGIYKASSNIATTTPLNSEVVQVNAPYYPVYQTLGDWSGVSIATTAQPVVLSAYIYANSTGFINISYGTNDWYLKVVQGWQRIQINLDLTGQNISDMRLQNTYPPLWNGDNTICICGVQCEPAASGLAVSFTRNSAAYLSDFTQVAANVIRMENDCFPVNPDLPDYPILSLKSNLTDSIGGVDMTYTRNSEAYNIDYTLSNSNTPRYWSLGTKNA